MKWLFFLLILVMSVCVSATVYLEDNFDSYSNGDLDGQGGWTAQGNPYGTDVEVFSGINKAIYNNDDNNLGNITYDISAVGDYFEVRANISEESTLSGAVTKESLFLADAEGDIGFWISCDNDENYDVVVGGVTTLMETDGCLGTGTSTWALFEARVNDTSDTVDILYNGSLIVDDGSLGGSWGTAETIGFLGNDVGNIGDAMITDDVCVADNVSNCNFYETNLNDPANETIYTEDTNIIFTANASGSKWDTSANITGELYIDDVLNETKIFTIDNVWCGASFNAYLCENAEDLIIGTLNGQNDWSGSSYWKIVATDNLSGNQHIKNDGTYSSSTTPINKDLSSPATSDGVKVFFEYMRYAEGVGGIRHSLFNLYDSSDVEFVTLGFDQGSSIMEYYNGTSWVDTTCSWGWLNVLDKNATLILNFTSNTLDIEIDGSSCDTNVPFRSNVTDIDGIILDMYKSNREGYDNICVADVLDDCVGDEWANPHSFTSKSFTQSQVNQTWNWTVNFTQDTNTILADNPWYFTIEEFGTHLYSPSNGTTYKGSQDIIFQVNAVGSNWDDESNVTCELYIDDVLNKTEVVGETSVVGGIIIEDFEECTPSTEAEGCDYSFDEIGAVDNWDTRNVSGNMVLFIDNDDMIGSDGDWLTMNHNFSENFTVTWSWYIGSNDFMASLIFSDDTFANSGGQFIDVDDANDGRLHIDHPYVDSPYDHDTIATNPAGMNALNWYCSRIQTIGDTLLYWTGSDCDNLNLIHNDSDDHLSTTAGADREIAFSSHSTGWFYIDNITWGGSIITPWANPLNFSNTSFTQEAGDVTYNWTANCSQGANTFLADPVWFFTFNGSGVGDTCTPECVGNVWDLDCSDNCNFDVNQTVACNVSITNAGILTWGANVYWLFNESNQWVWTAVSGGDGCVKVNKNYG